MNRHLHFALVLMFLSQKGEFQYNFLRLDLQPALVLKNNFTKTNETMKKVVKNLGFVVSELAVGFREQDTKL